MIIQDSAEFANEKPLRITGSPDAVERAKGMVTEILSQNDVRDFKYLRVGRSIKSSYFRQVFGTQNQVFLPISTKAECVR